MALTNVKQLFLLSPKKNSVFQLVFGESGAEEYTADFVSSLIGREIETLEYVSKSLYEKLEDDSRELERIDTIDMKVITKDKKRFNVSMAIGVYDTNMHDIYYHCERMKQKEFGKEDPIFAILLWEDNLLGENPKSCRMLGCAYNEEDKNALIGLQYIYLFNTESQVAQQKETQKFLNWMEFMHHPQSEKMDRLVQENELFRQARERLIEISLSPENQHYEALDILRRTQNIKGKLKLPPREEKALNKVTDVKRIFEKLENTDDPKYTEQINHINTLGEARKFLQEVKADMKKEDT